MRSLNSCEGSSSSKREKELAPLRSGKMQLQNFSKNDFGRARNPAGELAMPRHNRIALQTFQVPAVPAPRAKKFPLKAASSQPTPSAQNTRKGWRGWLEFQGKRCENPSEKTSNNARETVTVKVVPSSLRPFGYDKPAVGQGCSCVLRTDRARAQTPPSSSDFTSAAMSALMDLLANAATDVTAVHDSEAASILQQLFSSGRESSDVSASDAEQTAAAMGEAEADETPRPWTREEDELLRRLVAAKMGPQAAKRGPGKAPAAQLETREWRQIAENFDNRTAMQCAHRFQKVANPENVKGASATTLLI